MFRWIAIAACLAPLSVRAGAAATTLPGVPSYLWYHGCGPTAGGMIIGYWDARGFDALVPGSNDWATNQQAIKDMIASPGHVRDYVPTPDREATPEDPYHPDDCLADFMGCSRDPLAYGQSWESKQPIGLTLYAESRGYLAVESYKLIYGVVWAYLVSEIDAGRPIDLYVDTDGNGYSDHFVTAAGYDDTPGALRYACYNTYGHGLQWHDFGAPQSGQPYGVTSGTYFRMWLPGDANQDDAVNILDLGILAGNYRGTGKGWAEGDFNGDGSVNVLDLGLLAGNYRSVLSADGGTPVPEPMAAVLTAACVAALGIRRRRA